MLPRPGQVANIRRNGVDHPVRAVSTLKVLAPFLDEQKDRVWEATGTSACLVPNGPGARPGG